MRILYLAHRVPYAPNRGDRIRAYHTLKYLAARGHEVHVVALAHDADEERRAADLTGVCRSWDVVRVPRVRNLLRAIPALVTFQPLTHVLLDAAVDDVLERARRSFSPEVVIAFCTGVARWTALRALTGLPWILDLVDVDSAKWQDYADRVRAPLAWIYAREAKTLASFENRASSSAAAVLVISEREAELARAVAPGAHVHVVPNGVDSTYFAPPPSNVRGSNVVFTAVFDYKPNEDGAVWFVKQVWPAVRRAVPQASLALVGARPTRRVRALADAIDRVSVSGAVDDVRPYLWSAAAAIAPLWIARGLQNKVLEALAAGVPCVVTPAVSSGLPGAARTGCLTARDAGSFAAHVTALLTSRSPVVPLRELTWSSALAPLDSILETAACGTPPLSQ